jgi:hypothetical protein
MRCEDAVIDEQIGARFRNHSRKLFQQLGGFEADRPCAIMPRAAQAEQHLAVARQLETLLSNGRPQHVAAEVLQPIAISRRHGYRGMEIEAFEVRVQGAARGDLSRITLTPNADDRRTRTRSRRHAANDGRPLNLSIHWRFEQPLVPIRTAG